MRRSALQPSAPRPGPLLATPWLLLAVAGIVLGGVAAASGYAPATATAPAATAAAASASPRFQVAWQLVHERYWDLSHSAIDWDEARHTFGERPVADDDELDALLIEMYEAIGDDHSRYLPPSLVDEQRDLLGGLPCIGYFGHASTAEDGLHTAGDAGAPPPADAPLELRAAGPVTFALWPDGIGYLRVPDLVRPGVAEGVRDAVIALERGGASALVLDLRGNPGGRLVTMMQVAGVFTRGLLWRTLTRWSLPLPYPALGTPATDLPLAILVDAEVHSAAEGLAGALQAQGRAQVVGATTAGNVEAVLPFCLRDGSQAWIATGVLAPLAGPTWEGRGVEPDLAVDPVKAAAAARAALAQR